MNSTKTLPREPWRGSMICGWQIAYGLPRDAFCGERKADYRPLCQEHWNGLVASGDDARFAPNVLLGAPHWALRLLWEGDDPDVPVEPTGEETAAYAAALGNVR